MIRISTHIACRSLTMFYLHTGHVILPYLTHSSKHSWWKTCLSGQVSSTIMSLSSSRALQRQHVSSGSIMRFCVYSLSSLTSLWVADFYCSSWYAWFLASISRLWRSRKKDDIKLQMTAETNIVVIIAMKIPNRWF